MSAPRRERLAKTEVQIIAERSRRLGGDDEVYRANGFSSANEYWTDATAEIMPQWRFMRMLLVHHLTPDRIGRDAHERDLQYALDCAHENGEPWCIAAEITNTGDLARKYRQMVKAGIKERRMRPREAAAYLLSQPRHEHLVPAGLKAFLRSQKTAAAAPKKKRHRPKVDPVKILMAEMLRTGELTHAKLQGMTGERMEDVFDADSETCTTARREVLDEA
jgi:hypothetical protein